MPEPKSRFDETFPCDFYTPAELFEPDRMYTVPEIGRLLQDLDPEADLDEGTETVLIDWAVPWVLVHASDLVIGEPLTENGPGYYGVARHAVEGRGAGDTGDDGTANDGTANDRTANDGTANDGDADGPADHK